MKFRFGSVLGRGNSVFSGRRAASRLFMAPQASVWRTRLWSVLNPSTQGCFVGNPKPFEVTQKTPCCGRVTTEFFCPEIIAIWQNGQIADQPDNQLSITEYLQRQGELWQTQR